MNKGILLLLLVLILPQVLAVGITPGRTNVDFTPGSEQSFELTVINSENKDMNLLVQTRGELKDRISIEEESFSMSSNEYERKIRFTISVPEDLSPGLHDAEIVVIEAPEDLPSSKATVGIALAVATQVHIRVPYPGKYLEGEVKVLGDEKEKRFYVVAVNRGLEEIESASAEFHIYDASGNEIEMLESEQISIPSGDQKDIGAVWAVDAPLGKYKVKAIVNYDGEQILLESDFEVGNLVLEILNLFVQDFTLGSIAKFNLLVQNMWSEPINGAYAQMRVLDESFNEVADIKSSTYDIPSGERTTMVYYWDTQGVNEGLYNANILLFYAGKKTQQDIKLNVGQDSIEVIGLGRVISSESGSEGNGMIMILGIIIGFLVLLNILWFVVLRKRK